VVNLPVKELWDIRKFLGGRASACPFTGPPSNKNPPFRQVTNLIT